MDFSLLSTTAVKQSNQIYLKYFTINRVEVQANTFSVFISSPRREMWRVKKVFCCFLTVRR